MPDATDQPHPAPGMAPALKLAALDAEDLAILSTHLQDATVQVGDIVYLKAERRFALVASRFDWPNALRGICERCRSGIHFERVFKVLRTGFDQNEDRTLNLLAISFTAGDPPSGIITLTFSGGAAIRLEVECIEAALGDIGPRWTVDCKPGHPSVEAQHA